jgi:two-component system, sensor histidine kinase RegB
MLGLQAVSERAKNQRNPFGLRLALPANQEWATENASIARWLTRLRWVAIVAQLGSGIIGFHLVFLEPLLGYPFFGTICFLTVFNLFCVSVLKEKPTPSNADIFLQVVVDAVVLSFLLALSGGTRNPFVAVLFIHATLGALVLHGAFRGWFLALILACLVSVFAARHWQVLSSDIYVWDLMPLLALFLSLLVCWTLVASLSDTLQGTRATLNQARTREDRVNHLLALGALTAEFAHQFATPLNTLRMRLARLKRQLSLDENADIQAISDCLDQSERVLREMTTAPLDSSMLLFEEMDITKFISETMQQWQNDNPKFKLSFESQLKADRRCRLPVRVFAKSLSNLLDNAAFSASSMHAIEIELSESTNQLFISVKDRGPGWPAELLESGARPHFTTRPGGTGLGLFNCQSLCEVMGGKLDLLDREGGGAIAKLALPKVA